MQRTDRWSKYEPFLRSLLRIVAAFVFFLHGTQKLLAFPAELQGGSPKLFSVVWIAGVIETLGGALLMLGLFTRPVAFLLSGEMAIAYFTVHHPKAFWPTLNGGAEAVLFCFLWLYFAVAGAGPISIDRARRHAEPQTIAPH